MKKLILILCALFLVTAIPPSSVVAKESFFKGHKLQFKAGSGWYVDDAVWPGYTPFTGPPANTLRAIEIGHVYVSGDVALGINGEIKGLYEELPGDSLFNKTKQLDVYQSIKITGNSTIGSLFIGDVGLGDTFYGVAHADSANSLGYALAQGYYRSGDGDDYLKESYTFINAAAGGRIGLRINNLDKMVIANGGVGIGLANYENPLPGNKLEVNGNIIEDFSLKYDEIKNGGEITFHLTNQPRTN